jgi:hypothetical protein
MAKTWLNHYVDLEGQWQQGQPAFRKSSKAVSLGGALSADSGRASG